MNMLTSVTVLVNTIHNNDANCNALATNDTMYHIGSS